MRAVAIDSFGHRDQLRLVDAPMPEPGPRQLRIRVVAAGANPVDFKIREGLLRARLPHQFPIIPGWDAAGIVDKLGPGCRRFPAGAEVYAYCRKAIVKDGAYADYVVVDERVVAPKPAGLDFAAAAAMPLAALTAWQSLFDAADLRRGQSVLIHGGAGGVGHYAIQLARAKGARIWTTASARNHAFVRTLGARHVIDYTQEDFVSSVRAELPDGVDVVFDTVGGDVQARSVETLRKGGTLVSILAFPDAAAVQARGVTPRYVFVSPHAGQLKKLARLAERGRLVPHVSTRLPLGEAAHAHELLEGGHTRGKIVLDVAG